MIVIQYYVNISCSVIKYFKFFSVFESQFGYFKDNGGKIGI